VSTVEQAIAALRAGEPVVLPFDTVYGLAARPDSDEPVRKLYALKGRVHTQPSALVAASLDALLDAAPELREGLVRVRDLLPGPYTFILPNPARRFRWLTGENPDAIGVRIPALEGAAKEVVHDVGLVVATSANHPGDGDPATFEEVPEDIRRGAGAAVDGGPVAGVASTVIDVTGAEPRLIRRGTASPDEALRRLGATVRSS
jgi:L-threonylcarbamoyladenylate synthase